MSSKSGAQLQRGVIVEFDFAVLSGHQTMLDICSARLEQEGVALDAVRMARRMNGKSFSSGLNNLCNRQEKTVDVPAVIADCNEQFAVALQKQVSKVSEGFKAFVGALVAKGINVVLVTRMPEEALQPLLEGQPEGKVLVTTESSSSFCFTNWDGWRRAARKNELHERLCVAVAGSGFSVKGALNSGLGVLAKRSPLVEYQDFSGSDVEIDAFGAGLADDVVRILRV